MLACSRGDSGAPARGPATPFDPETIGTITGTVVFEGEPPASSPIQMKGDAACATEENPSAQDVLVRDGKVENAFVYVKDGLGKRIFELPKDPVPIDQRGCRYIPHVLGLQTGQELVFLNSDPTLHNVHTQPKLSAAVNFAMGMRGSKRPVRFTRSEVMVAVRCDVHPWMRAYVGVLDHPYSTVSGRDGSFRIANLPPGEYLLEAWHERFGAQARKVTLPPKGSAQVEFTFSAGES